MTAADLRSCCCGLVNLKHGCLVSAALYTIYHLVTFVLMLTSEVPGLLYLTGFRYYEALVIDIVEKIDSVLSSAFGLLLIISVLQEYTKLMFAWMIYNALSLKWATLIISYRFSGTVGLLSLALEGYYFQTADYVNLILYILKILDFFFTLYFIAVVYSYRKSSNIGKIRVEALEEGEELTVMNTKT